MNHSVLSGKDLHKRAEIQNLYHLSLKYFTGHNLAHEIFYPINSFGRTLGIVGGHHDEPVILNINLYASLGNDVVDDLAAWTDDFSDLFRIDMKRGDARSIDRHLRPNLWNRGQHFLKNKHPTSFGLFQSTLQNLNCQSFDLDIELERGNAVFGAGNFEIHVSIAILNTLNVAQDFKIPGRDI